MTKFNTICDYCYSPAKVIKTANHLHDFTTSCTECWTKHLKIRANEFGDFKCVEKDCEEEVSAQFMIESLKIDAFLVSDWKKNAINAHKTRINLLKTNGLQHVCNVIGCGQPVFKRSERDPPSIVFFFMAALFTIAFVYFLLGCNSFRILMMRRDTIFLSIVVLFCLLAFCVYDYYETKRKIFLVCSNKHVQTRLMDNVSEKIYETTRPCPNCFVRIEKKNGCNHVQCSQCNTSFCFRCCKNQTSCNCARITTLQYDE